MPDSQASKTTYARTYFTDTYQVEQLTTTQPVVSTADHGTGLDESSVMVYDTNGFNTWTRDARGIITHQVYDEITSAVARRIEDADPALYATAPAGWVAPSFGGSNLVTDIINDRLGRPVRTLGPVHTAVVDDAGNLTPCEPGTVSAQSIRTVSYTMHLCPRHQTWMAQGYVSQWGSPNEAWHLIGPVSIEQRDAGGFRTDTIHAVPTCACGPLTLGSFDGLDPYTLLPEREHWCAWTHSLQDLWGRSHGERSYYDIPENGDGFVNVNYLATSMGYDSMNRVNRQVAADGTISRPTFDPRGLTTGTYVGTDDTGATESDPTNGGADGNNLKAVSLLEYDDGNAGGNGNLTEQTTPVDDNSANDRVMSYTYDYRDRQTQAETSDGSTTFRTVQTYDNADNVLTVTGYHTNTNAANRISFQSTDYDARSRPFQVTTSGVDPSNGNLTEDLIAGTWYDPDGNTIQQTQAGNGSASKTAYDGLNRPTIQYAVIPGTIPSGEPANDISDDTVVEQSESTYNEASEVILTTQRMRLPDATGKGALGSATGAQPQARVSYQANYYDPIGRNRFNANYGTNGGATLTRPDAPATPSETVLVSESRYDAKGYLTETVATDGVINRAEYDDLQRQTKTIEACGSDAERTQRYRWHASGQMENLILENPDTGEQVTTWVFGSTLSDSEIARNDVIVAKQWPTGESGTFTVNRQSETLTHTQPNGTKHEYTRNKVGQLLHDAVTAVGTDIDDAVLRISTEYNDRGLPETVTSWDNATPGSGSAVNQIGYEYDAFNQLTADKQEHIGTVDGSTPAVTYAFTSGANNVLRPTSTTTPSGIRVDTGYGTSGSIDDTFNRPASLTVNGETDTLVEYTYAGLGMTATVTYPAPGCELSMEALPGATGTGDAGDILTGYDRFGRISEMGWRKSSDASVLARIQYGYDQGSRRIWREDLTPDSEREHDRFYGYDALSQVKQAAVGTLNENRTAIGGVPQEDESWDYDETGNWLAYEKAEDGTNTIDETRTNNESNQIVTVDGNGGDIRHDLNGNMTLVPTSEGLTGPARTMKWDAWNRLVEIRLASDDSLIGAYAYDGLTRRTTRTLSDNTVYHSYYNTNWRSVEEYKNDSSDPEEVFYWGAQSRWDMIRRDRDTSGNGTLNETLYCLRDAMDPMAIVDDQGAVQERYEYSAFGETAFLEPDYDLRSSSSFDWTFLFHGEFRDLESGYFDYGFRYYVPTTGRWASRDPIEEQGGYNLYAFAANAPIISFDRFGLIIQDSDGCVDVTVAVGGSVYVLVGATVEVSGTVTVCCCKDPSTGDITGYSREYDIEIMADAGFGMGIWTKSPLLEKFGLMLTVATVESPIRYNTFFDCDGQMGATRTVLIEKSFGFKPSAIGGIWGAGGEAYVTLRWGFEAGVETDPQLGMRAFLRTFERGEGGVSIGIGPVSTEFSEPNSGNELRSAGIYTSWF